MDILAKNIRALRQQHGWSQGDIAAKLGISVPAFSKIETGVTDVNLSRLEQIADVFSVPVVKLLDNDNRTQGEYQDREVDLVAQKLSVRESEISALQKKVIVLYEELRQCKPVY
jgi:transcriptional regulator with XRE-family HTH domain